MVKLSKTQIIIGKKLRKMKGGATADDLQSNYPDIEPLIRHKYVRVESIHGIPIYIMTPAGLAWADGLD